MLWNSRRWKAHLTLTTPTPTTTRWWSPSWPTSSTVGKRRCPSTLQYQLKASWQVHHHLPLRRDPGRGHPSLLLSTDEGPFPSQALRWHWCWHKTGKVTKSDVIYWGLKIIWSWLGPSQASDETYQRQGKRSGTCSPPCAVAKEYKNIFHQRSKLMSLNDDPPLSVHNPGKARI